MRVSSIIAFLLLVVLLISGCQRDKRKVIAVIPKSTSHRFWITVEAGAKAAGEALNVDVLWKGPATETDYSSQIEIVDSMISRRVDGIALAAAERGALVAPFNRAVAKGIPVTIFDSGLDSKNYVSFVATNNYGAGQEAARELARLIGGKGEVGVVLDAPGSCSTMDREKGFEDVLASEFPEIRIAAQQYGLSDRAKSEEATETILAAHPGLNGLFTSSEPSSVGAALAIKSRGLSGKIKFVSFDSAPSMIEDLKSGTISAMVVQDPFRMGYEAVRTLVDKINGKTPARRINLDARILHAADLAKPDVKRLLSPGLRNTSKNDL